MTQHAWIGWHFLPEDGKTRWPVGKTRRKVKPGQTLRVRGDIKLCERGLHASVEAFDALGYAPGPIVCRVRLGGLITESGDKAVATERTVLWMADATQTLHEFAVWCAERALKRERKAGREPDPRSWEVLRVKKRWLAGKATDAELAAAGDIARDAARDAAWAAAGDAAWAAAGDAAWAAAGDAARDAAWAAERKAQDAKLTKMLNALEPKNA